MSNTESTASTETPTTDPETKIREGLVDLPTENKPVNKSFKPNTKTPEQQAPVIVEKEQKKEPVKEVTGENSLKFFLNDPTSDNRLIAALTTLVEANTNVYDHASIAAAQRSVYTLIKRALVNTDPESVNFFISNFTAYIRANINSHFNSDDMFKGFKDLGVSKEGQEEYAMLLRLLVDIATTNSKKDYLANANWTAAKKAFIMQHSETMITSLQGYLNIK